MSVFTVTAGETFFLKKKIGSHGEAFRVASRQILIQEKSARRSVKIMPCVIFYLDDRKERKLNIVMHILFTFDLFSNFLDAYSLGYICNLLLSLI